MNFVIKGICGFVIILGGGYLGSVFASRYKVREVQLGQFKEGLIQLGFNISFLRMPAGAALSMAAKSGRGTARDVFSEVSKLSENDDKSLSYSWQAAIDKYESGLCITEEDKEILKEFANNLGKGDIKSEQQNIDAACAKLTVAQNRALGESERMVRLLRGGGFLAGMLVVVLLM